MGLHVTFRWEIALLYRFTIVIKSSLYLDKYFPNIIVFSGNIPLSGLIYEELGWCRTQEITNCDII